MPECAKAAALTPKRAYKTPSDFESLELLSQYNGDVLVRAKVEGKLYLGVISTYIESGALR